MGESEKYPHALKNLREQITAKKLNIHPYPLKFGGEDPLMKVNKHLHP